MFTRLRQAWRVLRGKVYVPSASKVIYVQSNKPPNTFVQLLVWRDEVLALDESGSIWKLDSQHDGYFVCQFMQESPRSY